MGRRVRAGALAAVVVAAVAAAPAAAQEWTPPQTLAGPFGEFAVPDVVVGADGRALTLVRVGDGAQQRAFLVRRSVAGRWAEPTQAPRFAERLVSLGGNRVLVAGLEQSFKRSRIDSARPAVSVGSIAGSFGRREALDRASPIAFLDDVDGNASGDAVVGWTRRSRTDAQRTLLVRLRTRSGRLGRAVVLAGPMRAEDLGALHLDMNDRGEVVAAWDQGCRIRARLRSAGGRWGRVQTLPVEGCAGIEVSAAIGRSGRAVVAWTSLTEPGGAGDEEFVPEPVWSAVRRPQGRFGTRTRLGLGAPGYGNDLGDIRTLVTSRDQIVVAWSDGSRGQRQARIGAPGRTAQTLSAPARLAEVAELEETPGGGVLAAWREGEGVDARDFAQYTDLKAAGRSAAGSFGPAEQLATNQQPRYIGDVGLAVDPRTRSPLAVWAVTDVSSEGAETASVLTAARTTALR